RVLAAAVRGLPAAGGVEGGTGDLQQLARPLDVAPALLLRLDERVDAHRVSFAKKAVARLRISTSSRSRRFSARSWASSLRSALVRPPSSLVPASRPACLTHSRTAVSVRSKSLATWPTDRSPRWHSSTISALNSGVNARRCRRGFFPTLSMIGHPSGDKPLMLNVRQSGSGPHVLQAAMAQVGLWLVTCGDACGLDRRMLCIPRMPRAARI